MDTLRYIITRACLQEGSMRLLRYLKPHFPTENGQVNFYDDAGHEYLIQVDHAQERLLGLADFYRQQHLGVNDVVMVTPLLPGAYKVAGIVKPHARPEPAREAQKRAERRSESEATPSGRQPLFSAGRTGGASQGTTDRVVTEATAHVREVRTQPAEQQAKPWASMERERGNRISAPIPAEIAAQRTAQAGQANQQAQGAVTAPGTRSTELEADYLSRHDQTESQEQRGVPLSELRVRRVPLHETEMHEARRQFPDAVAAPDMTDPVAHLPSAARRTEGSASAAMQRLRQDLASAPAALQRPGRQSDLSSGQSEPVNLSGQMPSLVAESSADSLDHAGTAEEHKKVGSSEPLPLDQMALEELGRRCGYRTDFPASGLVRLRANLADQRYGVLLADSGTAATHPEWRDTVSAGVPVYRLWLTHESQGGVALPDAGVLTREAVRALLAEVREQPFSPLDLRPFWEAGRMNLQSVEALREIRASQQRDKAKFAQLLRALAQQPAFGVVSPARLAAQLPALDSAQLDQWLSLLTRPPFLLLARLDDGTYLLERDVPELLAELGNEWLQLSGLQEIKGVPEAQPKRTWTAEELMMPTDH